MLQHRKRVCEAHGAQAACNEVVDIGEEAATMRGAVGGGMGFMENAPSMGCISDSGIEKTEEEKSMEGSTSVEGGGAEEEEEQREISWFWIGKEAFSASDNIKGHVECGWRIHGFPVM